MSSCISGGGRTYGFDLEILKSPSTSSSIRTPHSSSPSSTLSESSNSPITISTRKPRTPRKRPNQTYNEAAALLSTAYPNIFSPQHLTKSCKFTKPQNPFFDESSELLLPFRATGDPGCLLHRPILEKPSLRIEPPTVLLDSCEKSQSQENSSMPYDEYYGEDFDADSILDEEMGEGIDSIMGNLSVNKSSTDEIEHSAHCYNNEIDAWNFSRNFESVFGITRGMGALRRVDHEGDLWRFPTVDILQISPKFKKAAPPTTEKKKKKKKIEKPTESKLPKEESSILKLKTPESPEEISLSKPDSNTSLLLKLNYEEVLNAWSDRGSAFSDETPGSEFRGMDVSARLAEIDLFPAENGGGGARGASVLRYKEKRRTRLFSKKIRYQVRKVNADQRPRMKGRFVRRLSAANAQT